MSHRTIRPGARSSHLPCPKKSLCGKQKTLSQLPQSLGECPNIRQPGRVNINPILLIKQQLARHGLHSAIGRSDIHVRQDRCKGCQVVRVARPWSALGVIEIESGIQCTEDIIEGHCLECEFSRILPTLKGGFSRILPTPFSRI